MLDIAPEKVAHIIVLAREIDAKVPAWDTPGDEVDADSVLEARSDDSIEDELKAFIAELNVDEQASLVALMWIGRGTYDPDELEDAKATAQAEKVNPTQDYLVGIPMLADFLEDGLDRLGISVEDSEEGIL